jgi:CRISPR/Cas system Type II protein with McrA/HNH and RuvC-like nuclease domain
MAAQKRKGISKKTRFEVFKRDAFTCQYCGSCSPIVVLEIDHIEPHSKGGTDSQDNLITSCFDCNRGKSDRLLSAVPESIQKRVEVLKLKAEQIKEFNAMMKVQKRRENKQIALVEDAFQDHYPTRGFTDTFRESIRNFLQSLPSPIVVGAMERACTKTKDATSATKYFCGICWKKIKESDGGH